MSFKFITYIEKQHSYRLFNSNIHLLLLRIAKAPNIKLSLIQVQRNIAKAIVINSRSVIEIGN